MAKRERGTSETEVFNKKFAVKILNDIRQAKSGALYLQDLEDNIRAYLDAVDSTFPQNIRILAGNLVFRVEEQQLENGAKVLNTPTEFNYDENEGVDRIFDEVIGDIQAYLK